MAYVRQHHDAGKVAVVVRRQDERQRKQPANQAEMQGEGFLGEALMPLWSQTGLAGGTPAPAPRPLWR